MTDKYAKADFRAERQILWDTISLYYWAWECQVEVLEVLRGTVSTNNVTVRQLFTYTGATENATVTAKLVAQHHYVLFLSDRSNALGAGRFELTPFSLAVLQSPSYVIKGGGHEPESITHKELLRLIQRSSVDQFLLERWIEPANSEMQN